VDGAAAFLADPPESAAVAAACEADVTSDGYVNNSTRVMRALRRLAILDQESA
jgi:hypothetical protein